MAHRRLEETAGCVVDDLAKAAGLLDTEMILQEDLELVGAGAVEPHRERHGYRAQRTAIAGHEDFILVRVDGAQELTLKTRAGLLSGPRCSCSGRPSMAASYWPAGRAFGASMSL